MTTFNIDVVIDPAKAEAGTTAIESKLTRLTQAAARVGLLMAQAFGSGLAGAAGATFNAIQTSLSRIQIQATGIGASLRSAFSNVGIGSFNNNLGQTGNKLGGISTQAKSLGSLIHNALSFIGITEGVKELAHLSDSYTNVQNAIKQVTDGHVQLDAVTHRLFEISQQTRSSFETNANVYRRFALATGNLGISQNQLLGVLKTVNQAVAISGATPNEAKNGLIQLSQALSIGVLRGQDLRSVLEEVPQIGRIIAANFRDANGHIGITIGQLRLLGKEGKITSKEIIDALLAAGKTTNDAFGKTLPTIAQSFVVLRNSILLFVGEAGKSSGVTQTIAQGILALANNLDLLAKVLGVVAAVIITDFAATALPALALALLNPITLVAALAAGLVIFSDKLPIAGEGSVTVTSIIGANFLALFNFISTGFGGVEVNASDMGAYVLNVFKAMSVGIFQVFADIFNGAKEIFGTLGNIIAEPFLKLEKLLKGPNNFDKIERPFGKDNTLFANYDAFSEEDLIGQLQEKQDFKRDQDAIKWAQRLKAEQESLQKLLGPKGDTPGAETDAQKAIDNRRQKLLDGLTGDPLKQRNELSDLNFLFQKGKIDADQYATGLRNIQEEAAKFNFDKGKISAQQYAVVLKNLQIDKLEQQFKAGGLSARELADGIRDATLKSLELDKSLNGGVQRGLLQVSQQFSDVGDLASQTIVDGFKGAEDALVSFVTTGKLSVKDLVTSIEQDLARLYIRQQITGPLAQALGLLGSNQAVSTSGGGLFDSLVSGAGSFFSDIGSSLGFATGGSFTVGGVGSTDSQHVNFMATPGEVVNITRPGQNSGSGGGPVIVNVTNNTPSNVSVAQAKDGSNLSLEVIIDQAVSRNVASPNTKTSMALSQRDSRTIIRR